MTTISSGLSNCQAYTSASAMQRGGQRMHGSEGGPPGAQGPSLDELFSQIDTDGSGSISADELKTAMQPQDGPANATAGSSSGTATSATSLSDMRLNTQDFASMMGGGMPPPPPPDSADSTASTEGLQDLFKAIDGDGDGSLSSTEVNDFEKKLHALFEGMQQMGAASSATGSDASSALSVMA